MSEVADLIELMSIDQQPHIRGTATELVMRFSANPTEALSFFTKNLDILKPVIEVTKEKECVPVAKDAWHTLVNITALNSVTLTKRLIADGIFEAIIDVVTDAEGDNADEACMALGNITRNSDAATKFATLSDNDGRDIITTICAIFGKGPAFNKKANYHYLGSVLFNVSQTAEGRQQMLRRKGEGCVFQRLLPFTIYKDSRIRRGGAIGCIRNCCFSSGDHEWLMSDEVDILPHLLLPIIGGEELDDDDMDGMPDELQYMDPNKTREEDADIRKMLLETLSQLSSTRAGRQMMREKKVYPVLREYHKWEPEDDVKEACETVVDVLITPEMEDTAVLKGTDGDLRATEVPEDYVNAVDGVEKELNGEGKEVEKRIFQVGDHPEGYYLQNQADFQVQVGQ